MGRGTGVLRLSARVSCEGATQPSEWSMAVRPGLVILALLCSSTRTLHAFRIFRSYIPNGFNIPNRLTPSHINPNGGGPLTPFGKLFQKRPGWTLELCSADSDGDGQSNGQELGDPCCEWQQGMPFPRETDISD